MKYSLTIVALCCIVLPAGVSKGICRLDKSVSGHVMQLANAIPADKYSYQPQQNVRSVAKICAHIISANYFFPPG